MKAKGIFMFKSLQEREKGSFTNKETGEVINYDSCNILVADEISENGEIKERRFKFDKKNTDLVQDFSLLEPYTKIEITFNVILYSANAKVEPESYSIID